MDRGAVIRWLKRVHAWTGLWGALGFLFLGVSGFLLSHSKSVARIDTGAPREVSSVVVAVGPGELTSIEGLGAWAKREFGTELAPSRPRLTSEGSERVLFMGREVAAAEIWRQRFFAPNAILLVEYVPGSPSVKVTRSAQNGWGLIKNLHKASGMGIGWVLLLDLMAGALIAMSLSGALLWSRLHGSRLVAVGIVISSLVMVLFAAVPRFM